MYLCKKMEGRGIEPRTPAFQTGSATKLIYLAFLQRTN